MGKDIFRFKHDREISSPLAIILIMVLSFIVAQYCLLLAEEIVKNAQNSQEFNIQIREKEIN